MTTQAGQAVRQFAWFFPGCGELVRLASACDVASPIELESAASICTDQTFLHTTLLGLIASSAANSWRRHAHSSRAVLDAALALIGRRVLPPMSLLWPEYESLVRPVAQLDGFEWLLDDPEVSRFSERAQTRPVSVRGEHRLVP
jgi:hypothetical protein